MAAIFTAVILYITIHLLHDSYKTYGFDLGLFTQSLKYTLHGQMLWQTPTGGSELAHHFSPILFLLVPVYWVFPYAQMLLVVQGITLGVSGYLVYVLARDYDLSHRTSLAIEALFLLNPLVWGGALFDFHPVVFAIPGLLIMFLGIKCKNWILFACGLFITLISREDAIIAVGVFGIVILAYNYWKARKIDKVYLIIFISAVVAYGIAVGVSAAFSGGGTPVILSYFSNRYAYVDQPLFQAILGMITTVFSSGSLLLICGYLVPLGFLPLLSLGTCIPAFFIMLTGIISTTPEQHNQLFQYPAPAIPFLFLAFIQALPRVREDNLIQSLMKKTQGRAAIYALVLLLISALSIISFGRIQLAELPDKHDKAINQVIAAIPDGATVTANNSIFPHLCDRTETYMPFFDSPVAGIKKGEWGFPDMNTEYVVVDSVYTQADLDGVIWEKTIMSQINQKYELIMNIDGARLYKLRQVP